MLYVVNITSYRFNLYVYSLYLHCSLLYICLNIADKWTKVTTSSHILDISSTPVTSVDL